MYPEQRASASPPLAAFSVFCGRLVVLKRKYGDSALFGDLYRWLTKALRRREALLNALDAIVGPLEFLTHIRQQRP